LKTRPKAALSNTSQAQGKFTSIAHLHKDSMCCNLKYRILVKMCCTCEVVDNAAFGRVMFKSYMCVLSLCSCVVLVKVCYACEVFDDAAFGRVIFNHIFVLSLCSCVVLVKVCYAYERPSRQTIGDAFNSDRWHDPCKRS